MTDGREKMGTIEYIVASIDGDYAFLRNETQEAEELKCVARALLPQEIREGSRLIYEMFEYRMQSKRRL